MLLRYPLNNSEISSSLGILLTLSRASLFSSSVVPHLLPLRHARHVLSGIYLFCFAESPPQEPQRKGNHSEQSGRWEGAWEQVGAKQKASPCFKKRAEQVVALIRQPKISPHDFKGWLFKGRVGFDLFTILKLKAFQEIPQNLVLALAIVVVVRSAKKCTQLMLAQTKISQRQYRQDRIGL